MSDAWLSRAEVAELTDCKRRDVQCRRLAEMGVPFRRTYGGRPLVERAAVLAYKDRPARKPAEPDWEAMKAA